MTHQDVADEVDSLSSELRSFASNIGDGEMSPVDMVTTGNRLNDRMGDVLDMIKALRG